LAKFRFGLETLLRHREDIEQKERDELLRLSYEYQLELRTRDDLIAKSRATMDEFGLKQKGNPNPEEWTWYHLYLNHLRQEISKSEKRLAEWDAKVQAQKAVVIEASKKRKTLASMKSKKEKEFFLALEKQEQKEVDELVATRFSLKEPGY
jgi:flagellar export protein FliJ